MAERVASLYAEIGAKTDGLKAGLASAKAGLAGFAANVKSNLSGAGKAWSDMASPINHTIQILGQVGAAAQQAYQFISEGTQLATTERQFGALSRSIGATSDALLGELRTATRGTISDFKLMESATSIMSLGLADTSEETVRLASLVGKLGWDMNQVTLTLANQSTMRLDSLGLSVSDVTDRVAALKEGGMSADQAFKFAILEAGEAKVRLLGDAADTTAGKLKIMEANAANLKDSLQAAFSQELITNINDMSLGLFESAEGAASFGEQFGAGLAAAFTGQTLRAGIETIKDLDAVVYQTATVSMPALERQLEQERAAMIASLTAIDDRREAIESHNQVLQDGIPINRAHNQAVYESSDAYAELQERIGGSEYIESNAAAVQIANQRLKEWRETIPTVTGAVYASSEAVAAYNANLGELYLTARETEEASLLMNSGIRQTSGGLVEVSNLTEQQTDELDRMQTAYDKAAETIRDYELGIKGANLTEEERLEKIEEQRVAMGLLAANMQPLIDMGSEWITVQGQMISFGPAVADAFLTSGAAIGMNATELAGLELAFSDVSAAQVEARIKSALLDEEIARLTEQVKLKNITIYEARDAYIAFQQGLNDSTIAVNSTTGSVLLMNDSMASSATTTQNLLDKFGLFPDEVGTKVTVDTAEAESRLSSLEARLAGLGSGGQPATASGGYQPGPDAPRGNIPHNAMGTNFFPGGQTWVGEMGPEIVTLPRGSQIASAEQSQRMTGDTYNVYLTPANPDNVIQSIHYLQSMARA